MKQITALSAMVTVAVVAVLYIARNEQTAFSQCVLSNVEALTNDENSSNYNLCYSESVVRKGYTYYDCGSCKKVYDEKGKGTYSKCFY